MKYDNNEYNVRSNLMKILIEIFNKNPKKEFFVKELTEKLNNEYCINIYRTGQGLSRNLIILVSYKRVFNKTG